MSTYFPTSNVTIGGSLTAVSGTGSSTLSISGAGTGATWTSASNTAKISAKGQLHLEGDDADLVINGVKLSSILNGITDRLAILQPRPELLEKYANLREAYEHYKTLEALLHEDQTKV
jgi:hypothetical protein